MKRIKIAPSILAADFGYLAAEAIKAQEAGADYIHVDVMDGHFVPNITIGPLVVEALRPLTAKPLDVHLMIDNPDQYIEDFATAGADLIVVHAEASLNPATPLSALDMILPDLDLVLLMTVNPGFGGQSFITSCLPKIAALRERIVQLGQPIELEVDCGVKVDNIAAIAAAGADVFVAGSAVFGADDYPMTLGRLRQAALSGEQP